MKRKKISIRDIILSEALLQESIIEEALINVLEKKGLVTKQELLDEVNLLKCCIAQDESATTKKR